MVDSLEEDEQGKKSKAPRAEPAHGAPWFASRVNPGPPGHVPDDASFGAYTFQVLGSRLKPGCAENAIVGGFLDMIQASEK